MRPTWVFNLLNICFHPAIVRWTAQFRDSNFITTYTGTLRSVSWRLSYAIQDGTSREGILILGLSDNHAEVSESPEKGLSEV